ncbi:hypothetical protein [Hydrogenovibrio marinus]|uniref:Lipoprotein n=1 Tax=Hydrogenovibrio marinus TaxID=28885 RepID=A0A066ZS26_HYDMR|nr:hypothetical protein [Hydrogenovibrio marinus]KDN95079.1 hypothetical protein EI16_01845 [Hydrogenovibrio marinus]BBN59551.1 hypothetical protein HVMH_1145 [Hydrogenovibrio marinus]
MKRRSFIKLLAGLSAAGTALTLSGCGETLIRPDDKQMLAMLQFEMPDYEPTNENVLKKVRQWMATQGVQGENTLKFVAMENDNLQAKGVVTVHIKNKELKVSFNADITVVNANLIRFSATHFKDMPGPLAGESDSTQVFFNQVKDQVLTLCDRLENYLGADVGSSIANFQQQDLI